MVILRGRPFCDNKSLNPCFSGSWSAWATTKSKSRGCNSLNPCFSGSWSACFVRSEVIVSLDKVLILVLVEVGLRGSLNAKVDWPMLTS